MCRNILIISSNYTGHGHKSITSSLCELFNETNDVKVHVVDGFSLGGEALLKIGKAYGPITRNAVDLWKLIWNITLAKPALINDIIEFTIKDNLLELLNKVRPDLILSVHPNFNGSVLNVLEKHNIKIPFVTLIADLVSICPLWADSRCDYIISPTQEAKDKCIEFGVPESKIKVLGFPIRSKFSVKSKEKHDSSTNFNSDKPFKCLIMSGGEGVGNMKKIAEILLDNFNCVVKIVAGRNESLRNRLEKSLGKVYGNRVQIYGFMENIQDLMLSSDIAFTRGSPNVMLEAISCNMPIIITGALPGQEQGNPEYAEKYNLGVVCSDIKEIKNIISDLLADNGYKLNQIKNSQKYYTKPDVVKNIVNLILNIENSSNKTAKVIKGSNKIIYEHLSETNTIGLNKI